MVSPAQAGKNFRSHCEVKIHENCDFSDPDGSSTSNQRRRGAGQRRTGPINFEDLLQEILVSITDGASAGRAPLFFMGNPGNNWIKNYSKLQK